MLKQLLDVTQTRCNTMLELCEKQNPTCNNCKMHLEHISVNV